MVVEYIPSPMHWMGLSTDTKPTSPYGLAVTRGWTFFETNTGKFFVHNGTSWVIINP